MSTQTEANSTRRPRWKTVAFGLLAASLPLVVILIAELGLRTAGTASDRRQVFIAVDAEGEYLALNPDYAARYFQGFVPGVPFTPFRSAKGDSTFRVFVLGGSTTAGFPYRFYNGFPARLAGELDAALFGQRVEVVNLGMSAVNSYTVWDLGREALKHAPDAILVYAGHNEFYGAFGTGSTQSALGSSIWLKRLVIRLRRTVLYTLVEELFQDAPDPGIGQAERTLMARVVRDSEIAVGDPAFEAGLDQYRQNVGDLLRAFQRAGVATYVGTLVSNLADQPPLFDDPAALEAFNAGRRLLAEGRVQEARTAFGEARENDGIRFRAPDGINAWIRDQASALGANVVDLEPMFAQASESGVEDASLFTDHLHPNVRGYQLMATAFREVMVPDRARLAVFPDTGLDVLDEAHARLLLVRLLGDYPFVKDADPEVILSEYAAELTQAAGRGPADSLAAEIIIGRKDFASAHLDVARHQLAIDDTLGALMSYRSLLAWQPFNKELRRQVLDLGIRNGRYDVQTDRIALHAFAQDGDKGALDALGAVRLRQGHLEDAERILTLSEDLDPDHQIMLFNRARLAILQGDTLTARGYFERYRSAR